MGTSAPPPHIIRPRATIAQMHRQAMIGIQADTLSNQSALRRRSWLTRFPGATIGGLAVVALCIGTLALVALLRQPTIAPAETEGLYAREGQARPYNWTSSLATVPVRGGSGPTRVALSLTA